MNTLVASAATVVLAFFRSMVWPLFYHCRITNKTFLWFVIHPGFGLNEEITLKEILTGISIAEDLLLLLVGLAYLKINK